MSHDCPGIDELESYAEVAPGADGANPLAAHIAGCPDCTELLEEIRENLRVVAPLRAALGRSSPPALRTPRPPEAIGEYRILREIGRGGMGIVYEAEQRIPHRRVALKVLHVGFGGDQRFERMFRREAHALGRLRHPAIAAIYEAGQADDGRSFFAMELVKGESLGEFAARRRLGLRERLELFQRVCEAAGYAHERGVVHRDLKPSNILIESGGSPKILDFGLAKILSIDDEGPAASLVTETGRIQGTLPYMSPEQVGGDPADMDLRSDVYSLGVVLFELMTGRLPYDIDRLNIPAAVQTIARTPPRRASSHDPRLAGDVETIIHKCLEKEPDRRYANAGLLAADIGRYLSSQPILARPPTISYQLRKLVTRHKVPFAFAATVLVLLVSFAITMSILYARSQRNLARAMDAEHQAAAEAERAHREAETSQRVTNFLVNVFRVSDPTLSPGKNVTARELLDAGARRVRRELTGDPLVQAAMMTAIGAVYDNLGLYDEAIELVRPALAIRQKLVPNDAAIAESASVLASALRSRGQFEEAERLYRLALTTTRQRSADSHIHNMALLESLAEVLQIRGRPDEAEPILRQLTQDVRGTPSARATLPRFLNALAGAIQGQGRFAEAIPLMQEAIDVLKETEPIGFTAAQIKANMAWLLVMTGRNDEAERAAREVLQYYQQILPPSHRSLSYPLTTLGMVALNREKPLEAEPHLRSALEIRRAALPADHIDVAEVEGLLGQALSRQGRFSEALPLLQRCQDTMTRNPAASSEDRAEAAHQLAQYYQAQGRTADAEVWRTRARAASQPPDKAATANTHNARQ